MVAAAAATTMIDNERLSYLNLESLSVHLEITCLKYVSKVSSNTDHPLDRYQPQLRTTVKTHPKGLARPTSRTALSHERFASMSAE